MKKRKKKQAVSGHAKVVGRVTVLSLAMEAKRKMEDDLGDDQMQMETEEIAEVEVQRWMNVMLVEEEQIERQ